MPKNENKEDILKLINDIQHEKLSEPYQIALETEKLLEKLISEGKWGNAQELMELIKNRIKQMNEVLPHNVAATNVMRHILKVIREEHDSASKVYCKGEGQSLHQIVTANPNVNLDYSESISSLKTSLLDHLCEYKVEIESSTENIAAQALEHINTSEIILTFGKSDTVEKFLKYAAKERLFQVIVVEGAPNYNGHSMATSLASSNIQTTVISDSAVFAMMSRVNKVIIGTNAVMADGGLCASSGVHTLALAAKYYSVPVLVLAHMYKLTPVYVCSHGQDTFNVCASPGNILPYSMGPLVNKVCVYNPLFDYVPPELVTLHISHQGGNAPSYVYRLLSELYHPDDYEL